MVGAKREELQVIAASFEGAGHLGVDANSIEWPNIDHLVVELHLSGPPENDVDLFRR